jgi:hypothetical protein
MDTTHNKAKSMVEEMAGQAHYAADNLAKGAHQATDTAANKAKQATDQASGIVGTITDTAQNVASNVANIAGQAKTSVQHLAGDTAERVAHAKDAVVDWTSDAAHETGVYVKAGADQLTGLIRRYPITAVCVGISLGFLLAKATRV